MATFKQWFRLDEGCIGYVVAGLGLGLCSLLEAKKNKRTKIEPHPTLWDISPEIEKMPPPEERRPAGRVEVPKYDPEAAEKLAPFDDEETKKSCPITPLSGYAKHIKYIQAFANKSPENFAQTMMFSPLSANVPFPKHWDNFNVLMLLLKHYYPHKVTEEQLKKIVDSFDDKYHSLGHTVASFKLQTIAEIWSEKEKLFGELKTLASQADDRELITRLSQFTGVQPVKAGFMAQLLFGRAGCIDTHNIDIYSKIFPDMAPELVGTGKGAEKQNALWNIDRNKIQQGVIPPGVDAYVSSLEKLKKRGIGTEQLWDIWVDFVENFYRYISEHGMGAYTPMGSAIDKENPLYKALGGIGIPKTLPAGRKGDNTERQIEVPLATGRGGGASATHLQLDPDEMFKQRLAMYKYGEPGGAAAASIPFATLVKPSGEREPLEKSIGMAMEPSDVHYFGRKGEREIDPEYVRWVANQRMQSGGRKGKEERDRIEKELIAREKELKDRPMFPGFEPSSKKKKNKKLSQAILS